MDASIARRPRAGPVSDGSAGSAEHSIDLSS